MKQIEKRFVSLYRRHRVDGEVMEDLITGKRKKISIDVTDKKTDAKVYRWIRGYESRALYLAIECSPIHYISHVFLVNPKVAEGYIRHDKDGRRYIDCEIEGECVIV